MMAGNVLRANFKRLFNLSRPSYRLFSSNELDGLSTDPERSINHILILGRVGIEPHSRGSEDKPVTIFSVATNTTFKDENGDYKQKTEWHRICVFNPQLRSLVYNQVRKGQRCLIQGKIGYGVIKDSSGFSRPTTSIFADDIVFFPKRSEIEPRQSAVTAE